MSEASAGAGRAASRGAGSGRGAARVWAGPALLAARVWAGPALLAALFVALTAWSWRRWGSDCIDQDQQLYMAWQLSEGRDLYRDIAWVYGPFSQYLNALWFHLFGASYTTLIVCNLALLAGLCALLYRLLARLCDRLAATLALVAFLTAFAFAHLVTLGNYNFVTPYTHDATHGTMLCFLLLACLVRLGQAGAGKAALGAGLCVGAALLTKPEVALAAVGMTLWAFTLLAWLEPPARAGLRRAAGLVGAGACLSLAGAWSVLCVRTSPAEAWSALGAAFSPLAGSDIAAAYYFQAGLGLDRPWQNLGTMLLSALAVAGGIAALAALDRWLPARGRQPGWPEALGAAALFLALRTAFPLGPWKVLGSSLPLLTLGMLALFVRCALRAPDAATARRFVALSSWCVLALGLESKMPLNSRLHHYGFFLAAPATMLLVAVVAWWIPQELARRCGRGGLVRAAAVAAVLAGALAHLEQSQRFYGAKNAAFGRGGDTILTFSGRREGAATQGMQRALDRIEALVGPDETFVALPYGIMLNYQARRRSPSPHMRWTGLELIVYGEQRMLSTLVDAPPDWVVLVHCASQDEFQLGRFGEDPRSGRALVAWIREHYQLVERIGARPFAGPQFGVELRRRAEPSAQGAGAGSP
jgi:hypothetical protein